MYLFLETTYTVSICEFFSNLYSLLKYDLHNRSTVMIRDFCVVKPESCSLF